MIKEPSLSFYLPIAGEIIVGWIPFPKVLAVGEMLTALFGNWASVAVPIA